MEYYTEDRCHSPLGENMHFCSARFLHNQTGQCFLGTGWLDMQSVPGSTACRVECCSVSDKAEHPWAADTSLYSCVRAAASSLVEAGTVNNLGQFSKCVHGFLFRFLRTLPWLVSDFQSRRPGLIQGADPREELSQSRDASISTLQPLAVVSQTEQDSVFVWDVDVVPVWEDLLSEGAVVSAVGGLEKTEMFTC